ncbi:MAG: hypothetical protein ACRDLB_05180 [Actinomycetota bacterium]
MATSTLTKRAQAGPGASPRPLDRWFGHPLAYLLTTLILLALFGGTFLANPDRVAPTRDPAYYTWRTEALLSEPPEVLLEVEGPAIEGSSGMFEGGYRVTAPILGGFLRQVADVAPLRMTVVVMAILPVLVALLLAGFAYRQRRDPLIFHGVALGAGSLLLTAPFVGYLDNVLCLVFLAASLHLLPGTRTSWPARFGFGALLLAGGLTHPTTVAIFFVVLGAMAAVRLVSRRFDLRSVVADDGPMLITAFASVVVTYLIWKIGVWGPSAGLGDSALPPPYGSDFFVDRMVLWIEGMRPVLNVPLFLVGAAALLAAGRRAAEDELARVSIVWLAPLAGLFGFIAGLTYPYYRFFNTTLSWILLVGLGVYFATGYLLEIARRGGASRLALLGIVALGVIVATNYTKGFEISGWNDPDRGWISDGQRADLDALREELSKVDEDTPVVFVIDDEPSQPFQIYGFSKLSGNTSRYGMPHGQIDRAHFFLGSLDDYLAGRPTLSGEETYDKVSTASLEEAQAGIAASDKEPITVLAEAFNAKGANAEAFETGSAPETAGDGEAVWFVADGEVVKAGAETPAIDRLPEDEPRSGFVHVLLFLVGCAVLLIPGFLALRWMQPGATLPEALGLVPALAMTVLSLVGLVVLAVFSVEFSLGMAVLCLAVAIGITGVGAAMARRSSRTDAAPAT